MSDQTIHNPSEANGKPIMVGARGGLHTKDGLTGKTPSKSFGAPLMTCDGPGYDLGFFKSTNSQYDYLVRYKGPNAKQAIEKIEKMLNKGMSLRQAIDEVKLK